MLPVPPVDAVYQSKLVPVAVNVVPLPDTQRLTGVVTVGALGSAFTFTAIRALAPSQDPAAGSVV